MKGGVTLPLPNVFIFYWSQYIVHISTMLISLIGHFELFIEKRNVNLLHVQNIRYKSRYDQKKQKLRRNMIVKHKWPSICLINTHFWYTLSEWPPRETNMVVIGTVYHSSTNRNVKLFRVTSKMSILELVYGHKEMVVTGTFDN